MITPNIIPTKRAEPSKIIEKRLEKSKVFPFDGKKNKKKIYFLGKYQKYFITCVENISNSLVLRICEITDIFNTFDKIYLVFTSKKYIEISCIYIIGTA